MPTDVVIAGACRTAIGAFMGTLSEVSPVQLGGLVAAEAIRRAGISPAQVDEVILGSVLTAGLGQNLARQISIAAAQCLAVGRELGLSEEKLNVNGGAIALGHPIGASGPRILVTLLYEMHKRDTHLGLATLCIGGGMGTAVIVERQQA